MDTFGMSVGIAVSRRSGSRLATTLVDRYFHLFFSCFSFLFSVVYFSQRSGHLSAPCGIAGIERVPPAPLGWYH